MKFAKFLIMFASASLFLACMQSSSPNVATNSNAANPVSSPLIPATPVDELAQGRKLYMDNCAVCHKESGIGGKITIEGRSMKPDDLTSAKIKGFADDKIIGYVYNGIEDEGMPAFKDKLSEAEIRELVRYVRGGIQKVTAPAANKAMPQ